MRREYIAWFDMPNSGKLHGESVMPKQELIRCKDCAYYRPYSDGKMDCDNLYGMADVDPDGYCSRAERKE